MRRFLSDLKPSSFDDVIAAISLFRPGTLDSGMVDPFIKRKHGKEKVEYDHPLLEPVLRDTYGVIVYQEQVMRVAQALSGYTLQEADMLRAAMGKKNKQVMERERARFVEGAVRNGVEQALAQSIFEKIGTFASYGFNRSHAAAYALTTYITAYLKAHFPHEFMAALMSLDMDDADKTYKNIAALREMQIKILPPDVNQSRVKFTVSAGAIRFGLGGIRGVGAKTAEAIIAVRETGGPFTGLAEFCLRVGSQLVNRRVLEALIKCGAFDSTGSPRAELMAQVEEVLKIAQRSEGAAKNQIGLFSELKAPTLAPRAAVAEWPSNEKLKAEKEALGFYITAHPLDPYDREVRQLSSLTTSDLASGRDGSQVVLSGVVQAVKLKNSAKSGKRYATFHLEDREGVVEVIAWPETYQKCEAAIMSDEPVVARGKLDIDEERAQIILEDLRPLPVALADSIREVHIRASKSSIDDDAVARFKELLGRHSGRGLVYLHLNLDGQREAVFLLADQLRVCPTETFVAEASRILGPEAIELR